MPRRNSRECSCPRTWVQTACGVNFYFTGVVLNVVLACLWAVYSLSIAISAPFVAKRVLDHPLVANAGVAAALSFTVDNVRSTMTTYEHAAIGVNIFGWFMFSLAIINAILIVVGAIFTKVESGMGPSINKAATQPWNLVWIIPEKILAWGTPAAVAAMSLAQCGVTVGLWACLLTCKFTAMWTYEMTNMMCAEIQSTPKWNYTTPGCGVPDYSTTPEFIAEATCCGGAKHFCCALEAPFDYGLASSSLWLSPKPFSNSQRQIRDVTGGEQPTRMQYLMMTSYTNPFNLLWKQKTQAQDYAAMELTMLGIAVLFAFAAAYSVVHGLYQYTGMVKKKGNAGGDDVEGGIEMMTLLGDSEPSNKDVRAVLRPLRTVRYAI